MNANNEWSVHRTQHCNICFSSAGPTSLNSFKYALFHKHNTITHRRLNELAGTPWLSSMPGICPRRRNRMRPVFDTGFICTLMFLSYVAGVIDGAVGCWRPIKLINWSVTHARYHHTVTRGFHLCHTVTCGFHLRHTVPPYRNTTPYRNTMPFIHAWVRVAGWRRQRASQ